VATVVVLDHPGENVQYAQQQYQQQYQHQQQQYQHQQQPNIYKSNLLSNENVIAFASGVVIDDGSSVSAVAASPQIPVQKCLNVNTPSNRFQNVSRR